jgi:hypothetical protein
MGLRHAIFLDQADRVAFWRRTAGVAISWPGHIDDPGGIRNQFHHIIDIVPTILEAAHIQAPEYVDGIQQKPIEGVSMMYTFKKANANAPSTHHTQYFEMMGDHALYHDGWIASTKVIRPPWDTGAIIKESPADYPWELYDVTKDWTQFDNVVDKNPAKLKELEGMFLSAGRTVFTYSGVVTGTPNGDAPSILNSSYNFKAEIEVPDGGGNGMLVTQGGRFGGYGLYLLKGKPVFLWNLVDLKRIRWESPEALTPGKHTVEFDFKYEGLGMGTLAFGSPSGIGRGGTGVLKVDGKAVATQSMEHSIPFILQWDENFDVGADTGTPVDDEDYQVPFEFNGKLVKLTLTIDRPQLTPADIQKLQAAQRNNKASE